MFKSILLPIGNDEDVNTRIESAIVIAKKFDAHVKGLHVVPTLKSLERLTPYAYYSYDLYTHIWETQKSKAVEQKKNFLDMIKANIKSYEWCEKEGDFMQFLKQYSRTSDLTIFSQVDDTYTDIMGTMARFMMESSLPVVTVPSGGINDNIGDNILIAWDASAESARAVHDAMPFLKVAKKVTVVSISENKKNDTPTDKICEMLKRNGIKAKGINEEEHYDRASRILQLAKELDVSLIVAGAWGHTRLLEIIFGGVTKTLFTNQEISVFFSH